MSAGSAGSRRGRAGTSIPRSLQTRDGTGSGHPRQETVTFDLIQFFTGEAATKAAAEDGEESPPPNDYYIRNVNDRLRTLPVADDAPITVNVLAAQTSGDSTKNVSVTLAELPATSRTRGRRRSGSPWPRAG